MKILVLNGSPRPQGNTAQMVKAFKEGAESKGHQVDVIRVAEKKIAGCLGCDYCINEGNGTCIQDDDMKEVTALLRETEMLVLASPIYYHNMTGQLKCVIDRFYAPSYPNKPESLTKVGMILCSGEDGVYDGALYSLKNDFVDYMGLENMGVVTVAEDVTSESLAEAKAFGEAL